MKNETVTTRTSAINARGQLPGVVTIRTREDSNMTTTHFNREHDNPLNIRLGKICCLCDVSCEGRPRVKDSQGHYYCRSCYQEQRRRRAERQRQRGRGSGVSSSSEASLTLPNVDADAFADIHVEQQRRCTSCRSFVAASDVVCIHCGFNRATQQHVQTVVQADEPSRDGDARKDSKWSEFSLGNVLSNGWLVFACVQIPFLIMFFNAYGNGPRGVDDLWMTLLVFDVFVWMGVLIAAAMTSVWWALACMVLPFVSLWWVYVESESGLLKILVTVSLVNEAVRLYMMM